MINRQLTISSVTLEVFKRMKPGDQRLYLGRHPHSRYHSFHRRPTNPTKPIKVAKNTFSVDSEYKPADIEKASNDLANNNPELEKQVESVLTGPELETVKPNEKIEQDSNEKNNEFEKPEELDPVDVTEKDYKRSEVNKHMDKKASAASTVMWALLTAGALIASPILLPFADLVSKEFGDTMRKDYEKETDKELTYEEFSEQRNKTGRTLTKSKGLVMRKQYAIWKELDGENDFELRDKKQIVSPSEKDSELERKKSTKEFIKQTAAKAITWIADKGMKKLEARYANMKRLQALNEPPVAKDKV